MNEVICDKAGMWREERERRRKGKEFKRLASGVILDKRLPIGNPFHWAAFR